MKKLMVLASAAGLAGVAMGVSSGVVGYTTREMNEGFRLLSIPFQSAKEGYNINDVAPYTSTSEADWTAQRPARRMDTAKLTAPQMQVQIVGGTSDGTYQTWYYITNAYYEDPETGEVSYIPGWASGATGAYATTGETIPGVAVWFKDSDNDDKTLTTLGGVIDDTVEITCKEAFRLRAPAYPAELDINSGKMTFNEDFDTTAEADWTAQRPARRMDTAKLTAPQIQIQVIGGASDGTYQTYYYINNAYYEDPGTGEVSYIPGWATGTTGAYAGDAIVPVNGAFWIKGTTSDFTLTLNP